MMWLVWAVFLLLARGEADSYPNCTKLKGVLLSSFDVGSLPTSSAYWACRTAHSQGRCWKSFPCGVPGNERSSWLGVVCLPASCDVSGLIFTDFGFSGPIPQSLGLLRNLSEFRAEVNFFTGSLEVLRSLPGLCHVDFSHNFIQDSFEWLCQDWPLISLFLMSNNRLTGAVPDLTSCTNLVSLDVQNNDLDGEFASLNLRGVPKLSSLFVSNNRLHGSLPRLEMGPCGSYSLSSLYLSGNLFEGSIPDEYWKSLFNCSTFTVFDVSNSSLGGQLQPTNWSGSFLLEVLDVSGNAFNDSLVEFSQFLTNQNIFYDVSFPLLQILNLAANRFSGWLRRAVVVYYANILDTLDLSDNALISFVDDPFAAKFELLTPIAQRFWPLMGNGTYRCPIFKYFRVEISLPAHYFSYRDCECVPGYWGIPPNCAPCGQRNTAGELLKCLGGPAAILPRQLYPTFLKKQLHGFDECASLWNGTSFWSPCNRYGNVTLDIRSDSVPLEFCTDFYTDRLCSRCDDGAFASGSECLSCDKEGAVGAWLVVVVFFSSIVFFLVIPKTELMFLWGEIVTFIVALAFGGGASWMFTLLLGLLVVQAALQAHHYLRNRVFASVVGGHTRISVSGFTKLFIFFVQTNGAINKDFWAYFAGVFERASILHFRLNGVECVPAFKALFESEIAKFLFYMALPIILILMISVGLSFQTAVLFLLRKYGRCCRKRSRGESNTLRVGEVERLVNDAQTDRDNILVQASADKEGEKTLLQTISTVALFLLFAFYFELTERVVSVFRYSHSSDGSLWMEELPWIPFDLSNHLFAALIAAAATFAVIYVIGIPVLFWRLLRFHDHHNHPASFLWENYQPKRYWYEMLWIFRRLLLAVGTSLIREDTAFSPVVIVGTLGFFLVVQFTKSPFLFKMENTFDLMATVTLLITYAVNLWSKSYESEDISPAFYVVVVLNGLYVISLVAFAILPLVLLCSSRVRQLICSKRPKKRADGLESNTDNSISEI